MRNLCLSITCTFVSKTWSAEPHRSACLTTPSHLIQMDGLSSGFFRPWWWSNDLDQVSWSKGTPHTCRPVGLSGLQIGNTRFILWPFFHCLKSSESPLISMSCRPIIPEESLGEKIWGYIFIFTWWKRFPLIENTSGLFFFPHEISIQKRLNLNLVICFSRAPGHIYINKDKLKT